MPPLGRHYSEIWEELDRHYYQLSSIPSKPSRPPNPYAAFTHPAPAQPSQPITLSSLSLPHSIPPPNTGVRWDPASLTEGELVTDERGSGPLTERIFSAFLFDKVKLEEEGEVGRGFGLGRGVGQGTVGDLEERLMKECKSLGLIMNEVRALSWGVLEVETEPAGSRITPNRKTIKSLLNSDAVSVPSSNK